MGTRDSKNAMKELDVIFDIDNDRDHVAEEMEGTVKPSKEQTRKKFCQTL